MGGGQSCGGRINPDTETGPCNNLGDLYTGKHFCNGDPTCSYNLGGMGVGLCDPSQKELNAAKYQAKFCESLSPGNGEWAIDGYGDSCLFDLCDRKTLVEGPCNGCAALGGNKAICRRVKFTADPLACCFRDFSCVGDDGCFQTDDHRKTCDPKYRDGSSQDCRDLIYNYCIVDPPTESEFVDRWLTHLTPAGVASVQVPVTPVCQGFLYRGMYTRELGGCGRVTLPGIAPDPNGLAWGQKMVKGLFDRYTTNGGVLDGIYQDGMSVLLDGICRKQPILCQQTLERLCVNITPDQISRDPGLLRWCGCYMSEEAYDRYVTLYGIQKECTPSCNNAQAIPLPGDNGFGVKQCRRNTCVVDDLAIDIGRSIVGSDEGISINQACYGCAEGGCQCLMADTTIRIIESRVGSIQLTQQCQGHSTCYKEYTGSGGVKQTIQVPCDSSSQFNPLIGQMNNEDIARSSASRVRLFKIFLVFIIMIIVIIIIWLTLPSMKFTSITSFR